jgi:tetratricopeptide (TPR) repeat protein
MRTRSRLAIGLTFFCGLMASLGYAQNGSFSSDARPRIGIARTKLFTPQQYLQMLESLSEEQIVDHRANGDLAVRRDEAEAKGDLNEAIRLALECIEGETNLLGEDHAKTAFAIGRCGEIYHLAGKPTESMAMYERALQTLRAERGPVHPTTLTLQIDQANLFLDIGEFARGLELHRKVCAAMIDAEGLTRGDLAVGLIGLATAYRDAGDYPRATASIAKSIEILESLEDRDDAAFALALTAAGTIHQVMARFDKAQADYLKALELEASNPVNAALLHKHLAVVLRELGRMTDAEAELELATEQIERLDQPHPVAAFILLEQAKLDHMRGRSEDAEAKSRAAAKLFADSFGPTHLEYGVAVRNVGVILAERGKLQDAEQHLSTALELFRNRYQDRHPLVATTLQDLARIQQARDNKKVTKQLLEAAATVAVGYLGREHPEYAQHLIQAAKLYRNMGEYGAAEGALRTAGEVLGEKLGKDHPEYARAITELGGVYLAMQKPEAGREMIQEGGRILARRLGADHPDIAEAAILIADYYTTDDPDKAEKILRSAAEQLAEQVGPRDRQRIEALLKLGDLYVAMQKPDNAEQVLNEAIELIGEERLEESAIYRKAMKTMAEVERARDRIDDALNIERRLQTFIAEQAADPRAEAFGRIAAEIQENVQRR